MSGNIFVTYNLGTEDIAIGEMNVRLDDGIYHVVRFTRSGANSTLQVDDNQMQIKEVQGERTRAERNARPKPGKTSSQYDAYFGLNRMPFVYILYSGNKMYTKGIRFSPKYASYFENVLPGTECCTCLDNFTGFEDNLMPN